MYLRKTNTKKKRVPGEANTCIIYTRVSSKEQIENFSLDSQEKLCRDYAALHKLKVLKLFREEGESAKTADREQLQLLLQYCNKYKWGVGKVLVYKTDRMARNMDDFSAIRLMLEKSGTTIVAVTEPNDDSDYSRFIQNLFANFAELDNRMRAQRTLTGMRARLLHGDWCWPAPLGYVNKNDDEKKTIVVHPTDSHFITWMFEEYAKDCYTFKQLAKQANKKGLLSRHKKKMSAQLVQKILTNPFYCGRIEKPEWDVSVEGNHTPLISEKLFLQVKLIMEGGNSRKVPRSRDNPDFPLRGIVCIGCGGHMSGGRSKGRSKYYPYYSCINKDCSHRKAISKDELEKEFTHFLRQLAPDLEFAEALRESIRIARTTEMEAVDKVVENTKKRIEQLRIEKEKLLRLNLDGALSTEDFKEYNDRLTLRIHTLESEYSGLEHQELAPEGAIEAGLKLLRDLPETWQEIDVTDFRVLRQQIFPENVVYTYPGFKTVKLSPIYKLSEEYRLDKNCLVTLTISDLKPLFGQLTIS